MAASNINRVIITGNLTADPELRSLPSGTSVCKLRVACNTRRKDGASGEWVDKPNYFDVTVWGAQGENCATLPGQGPRRRDRRPPRVARVGDPRGHQAPGRRHRRRHASSSSAAEARQGGGGFTPRSDVPVDTSDFQPAPVGGGGGGAPAADDDIPF